MDGMENRKVIVTRSGGPSVLEVTSEGSPPDPGRGQVRVRVEAAGVAFADVMMREGIYPGCLDPPFTPGYDMVGVVDCNGEGANAFESGDRVAALTMVGAYADYMVLPETDLVKVPEGVDPAEAVCLVLNYLTALQMLKRVACVESGGAVLIHGAAGGVGTAMLELCRLEGIEVIGTASAAKHEVVTNLGGKPIDYRNEDFVARTLELTDGRGVDAAFDPIGGSYWKRSYQAMGNGGTMVAYGYYGVTSGGRKSPLGMIKSLFTVPGFKPPAMIGCGKSIAGYNIMELKKRRLDWYREDLAKLLELLAEEKLKPLVAERISLDGAALAHQMMGERRFAGKLVLVTGGE